MKRHGSMNHIYRVVWSEALDVWVAVAEITRSRGKTTRRRLVAATLLLSATAVSAEPTGGQVTAGAGAISHSGVTTTITQSSQNLSVNWRSFDVAVTETVNFVQPSVAAIAVNRILDPNGTKILGQLNANGQVYLINPNGVLFGRNAQVNVGGLVASTLQVNEVDGDSRSFSGDGRGSVINQGTINAANGGYVALLGNNVSNQGVITAQLGTVALGAGSAASLTFSGNSLVRMQVDRGVLDSVAENGGLIRADGGKVLMSAGASDELLASVVNNTGVVEARTMENRDGTIVLLGGMSAGTVNVGGTLDASAPTGGDGGFVETSAAHVKVASGARVTTAASAGQAGTWLIDPFDFTIASSGGDMTGADLSAILAGGDVTIQSSAGMLDATADGDINVNDRVTWSAHRLTLNAYNDININAQMDGSGSAALTLEYGQGATEAGNLSEVVVRAPVNLPNGPNFNTQLGNDGSIKFFSVISDLGVEGSTTANDLQGMSGDLSRYYALGGNIDALSTASWNAGAGFTPIGALTGPFNGTFDGLGHVISGLAINLPGTEDVGLFGNTSTTAAISNVGLIGGSVIGAAGTGGLVGNNGAGVAIRNSFNTGNVTGAAGTGGLVGSNGTGAISESYATGAVIGAAGTGGLVGSSTSAAISNSYSTGDVDGAAGTGGLIGSNTSGPVSNTYATGNVNSSGAGTGGLIGSNASGLISNSYSTGLVTSLGAGIGGLIGSGTANAVTDSYWNTDTSGLAISPGGGEGRTSAEMTAQDTFVAWDFAATWIMFAGTNPLLQSLMTPLTVTANALNTTYNATANSGGNGVTYSASLNGIDPAGTLGYSGNSQGALNAGTYAITPSGLVSDQQYLISFASGTLTIAQAAVTLTTSDVTKIYDGGLTALGTATVSSGSLFSTDAISGGTYAFTDKNVGSGNKTVTTSGVTVSDGNNGANYNVSYADNTTSTISAANLAVTGVTAVGRVYDGTSDAPLAGTTAVAALGSDVISLDGAGAGLFADRNVGTAKAVTVTGYSLSGVDAGNYSLAQPSGLMADVTAAALTLSTSDVSKTYDGALSALGTATVSSGTLFSPDALTGGTYAFTDKNVGSGTKTVTTSGVTVSDGNNGANYNVSYADNTTSTISAANLAVTGVTAVGRVYDGTSDAPLTGTAAVAALGSDVINLDGIGAGLFTDRNVGTTKVVAVSGYLLSGADAGNYLLAQPGGLSADVTAALLTLSTSDVTKTYDGGLTALGTATVSSGTLFSPDALTGGTYAFTDKNVGSGNKTVTTSGVTVSDGNGGANYNVSYADNITSTISAANLAVTGVTAVGRVYDGTSDAPLAGTAAVATLGSDVVSLDGAGAGLFADRNVGTAKALTVTGYSLSGADAGNYSLAQPSGLTADVTAAALTLSTSDVSKTYDGGLSALGTATVSSGTLFSPDALTGGTYAFTDENVGSGAKTVTTSGVTVSDGNGGANYNVSYADNTTSTISAANLTLSSSNVTKSYDGGLTALGTATVEGGTLFSGDALIGGSFAFTDKNVGADKTVTVAAVTVNDGNGGGNYNISYGDNTTSTITAASLAVTGVTAVDTRGYDGTTAATLGGTAGVNGFGVDVVTVDGSGSGAFADRNVGIDKQITVTGFTLTGSDAANYAIVQPTGLRADITAADLTLSSSNVVRVYDGGVAAAGTARVSGGTLFSGDSLGGGRFAFTDKNVGSGDKTVTAAAITVNDGNSGANYNVSYANNTTSTITAADLVITGVTADNKIFDGTTAATLGGTAMVNAFGTDIVSVGGAGSGVFDRADIGARVGVTVSDFMLSGVDASNYIVVQPTGLTANIMTKAQPQAMSAAVAQLESNLLRSEEILPTQSLTAITSEESCSTVSAAAADAASSGAGDCAVVNIGGMRGPRLQIINGGTRLPSTRVKLISE